MPILLGLGIVIVACVSAGADLLIEAVNVGYGDCYVLQERHAGRTRWTALVDAGPTEGVPALLETLQRNGVQHIHDVFLTHGHPNHTGALLAILDQFPIQRLYWRGWAGAEEPMVALLGPLRQRGVVMQTALSKHRPLNRGRVTIDILNPEKPLEDPHEGGLVLLLTYGKQAFLFAGDASPGLQERLWPVIQERLRRRGAALEAITWPHHGDVLAPSWEVAMTVVPHLFVGVGTNSYGLPRDTQYPELLRRALRTDKSGNQHLVSDGKKARLQ